MGVDMYLLPFDCDIEKQDFCFSHTILNVNRDYGLFDKISKIESKEVSKSFTSYLCSDESYEERHYGTTTHDSYGERLKYVLAGDLKKCEISGPTGAYINALDDNTKVAIFWY